MSFIDIFIKREEEIKQEQQPAHNDNSSAERPVSPEEISISPANVTSSMDSVGETDELLSENKKMLWQTLTDRNLPGPDMLELLNTASSLHGMGMTKDKEFEAAFRMLRTQYPTFTKENLLESVNTYIGFINEELEDGTKQFAERRHKEIGGKEDNIAMLEQNNVDIEEQIKELKMKLQENNDNIAALRAEVAVEASKLDYSEGMFRNSVNAVIAELNENKKIMETINI